MIGAWLKLTRGDKKMKTTNVDGDKTTRINITGATVFQNTKGTDSVILYTDLPNGTFPYEGTASAEIKVASGGGEDLGY